ncbi:hypothetical protein DSO57_1001184 [Entomophthora muscae]|uniref:Uncharacterized protein n=1 Tax=Entomophthora muscae TaxID=34485 RepID=A0ACC2TW38_9FUNG|nr:hypothetical protein DSO57_1001184 [Entomophthora muscae]
MQLIIFTLFSSALAGVCPTRGAPFAFGSRINTRSIYSGTYTTLYSQPGPGQQSGAQFPYIKNVAESEQVGLATVSLLGKDKEYILQTEFAPIAQECSCYWLDAKELAGAPHYITSGEYHIRFKEETIDKPGYDVISPGINFEIPVTRKLSTKRYISKNRNCSSH